MKLLHGLIASAVAAGVASLIQLPLTSPDDAVLNSGTVTIAALAAGLYLGALSMALSRRPAGMLLYAGAAALSFGAVAVCALISEQALLDGSIEFMVPVAAIVFAIATPLVVLTGMAPLPRMAQYGGTGVAVVAALAIGIGLSGQGDAESGELSLPDVSAEPTAAAGETLTPDDVAGLVYTVVPGESEFTYTVREKLVALPASSDAVGRTRGLSGEVRLDGASEIQADMSTLASDNGYRDADVSNRIFNTDPIVTFVLDSIGGLPEEYVPGTDFTGTVTGTATVRGVERPLTFAIEARLVGDELQVHGAADFTWDDFQIPPPDLANVVKVENDVHIEVLLIARAGTGA